LFRKPALAAAFDALQRSPGIFDAGMMIGTLQKVLSTNCYEVSTYQKLAAFTYNVAHRKSNAT
jgi:hypothetical protein